MPIELTEQTGGALLIGLIIGLNIGFALGAWWHALRTERRAPAADGSRLRSEAQQSNIQ